MGYERYLPRSQHPPALQRFWTDLGMIDPEKWHYCARYDGPQVSRDVWVWRK